MSQAVTASLSVRQFLAYGCTASVGQLRPHGPPVVRAPAALVLRAHIVAQAPACVARTSLLVHHRSDR